MSETNHAERFLREKVEAIVAPPDVKSEPINNTLAVWRLQNDEILKALRTFAAGADWTTNDNDDDIKSQQEEVLSTLFRPLNDAMWDQEATAWRPDLASRKPDPNDLPVVFGGKYAAQPRSISEKLVSLLAAACPVVYTVSRSDVPRSALPVGGVVHLPKRNLDCPDVRIGSNDFVDVFAVAFEEWVYRQPDKTLVLYFTLGQHKGTDPFARNVYGATNFATALRHVKSRLRGRSFRVVLTGTDATLPSTHLDSTVELGGRTFTVPSYKIGEYNFVYAMSKLCQFYIVADAIAEVADVSSPEVQKLSNEISNAIGTMKAHIAAAGEDGSYRETASGLSKDDLDRVSFRWRDIQAALRSHLMVAEGISICYTPLHCIPWTEAAVQKCNAEACGSPKAFVLQQVIQRLKNAVSIEHAARLHFPVK